MKTKVSLLALVSVLALNACTKDQNVDPQNAATLAPQDVPVLVTQAVSTVYPKATAVDYSALQTNSLYVANVTTTTTEAQVVVSNKGLIKEEAVKIAKTDLLTDMVGEFPELQGIMGRYYAVHDGENPEVAAACSEHYMPRFAGDALPQTTTGTILAIADKLETLVGIWGVGLAPTGDKDPYALRRHALGICRLLLEKNLSLSLPALIELARSQFPQPEVQEKAQVADVYAFIIDRLRAYLRDQAVAGKPFTSAEIDAVLSQSPAQINDLIERLAALREFNALAQASQLAAANKRISNILKKTTTTIPEKCAQDLLQIPAEAALFKVLETVTPTLNSAYEKRQFVELLKALVALSSPIDQFFEDVMVMDPNTQLRDNRLALLQQLHQKMNLVADLGKLA